MVRNIIIWPDKRLTQVADWVTEFDDNLKQFGADLEETMLANNGKGLAATQVGEMKRVISLSLEAGVVTVVNPQFTKIENVTKQFLQEGCLSIPGVFERIERDSEANLVGSDTAGLAVKYDLKGYDAVAALHEVDHLDGKMFTDYLSPLKRSLIKSKMKKYKR
jgi:peptide deformylase